jgi:soluble lytic murein transglycosylase-like protein
MQVMPSSATKFNEGKRVSSKELRNNIELNVKISMRMLSYLKRRYGTWGLALGAYNTGKPCYNSYANRIIGNDSPVRKPF